MSSDEHRAAADNEVTFLFTDIEGSTSLFHQLGDLYVTVLDIHHAIMRAAIAAHGGHEVQTEGDAFFITFDDPRDAVASCLDAQLELAGADWPHGEPVKVRMGMHRGAVTVTSTDEYVGLAVHEAARIAATAHGGQIVLSDAIADAVPGRLPDGAGLHDLGRHALKDFPEPRRLFQLTHSRLVPTFPPLRSLTARDHNLVIPATPIVGRDADVADIVEHLTSDARLLTITGEGGLGKTRLALECAWQLLSWFKDGVWLVELADVVHPDGILPTIATTLGIDLGADDPTTAITTRVGSSSTLLVIDNLEHLLDGVTVLTDLLARCPNLRLMATSRERLRLRGERRHSLEPLTVPDGDSVAAVRASATAQLFMDRAAWSGNTITVDAQTAPHLGELCRQLDGLPLAVELAAARLDDMSLAGLAAGLANAVDLLDDGDRDLPPRQRALRSAIAWSEDLLTTDERDVFRCCAVFVGPFDVGAIAAVCELTTTAATKAAQRLTAAGLARTQNTSSDLIRWRYLMPIRQYAADALRREGRLDQTNSRLVQLMVTRAEAEAPLLTGHGQADALARLAADHENHHAAMRIAPPDDAARLGAALTRYYSTRGHWRQGRGVLQKLWNDGAGAPPARVHIGLGLALLQWHLGDLDEAAGTLDATMSLEEGRDNAADAMLHNLMASVLLTGGAPTEDALAAAVGNLDLAEQAAEATEDPRLKALVLNTRANLMFQRGDFEVASEQYRRLTELWSVVGDEAAEAEDWFNLANCLLELERHAEAVDAGQRALDRALQTNHHKVRSRSLLLLARAAWSTGDPRGRAWAEQASETAEDLGEPYMRISASELAEDYADAAGDRAARLRHVDRMISASRELGRDDWAEQIQIVRASLVAQPTPDEVSTEGRTP